MRWSAVVVVIALLASARASAQDRVHFTWQAPAGVCPPVQTLIDETEQALGPASGGPVEPVSVNAIVSPLAHGRLRITLVMHFPTGDAARAIDARECASLVHAAALIVALAMQPEQDSGTDVTTPQDSGTDVTDAGPQQDSGTPDVTDAGVPPQDSGTPDITDASAPPLRDAGPPTLPDAAAPPSPPSTPGPTRLSFELVAQGFVDVGTLPNAAPGFAAGAGLRYDDFHLELLFVDLPDGEGKVNATQGGRFGAVGARLAGALDLLHAAPFTLAPTVALEVGDLSGRGFGVSAPGRGDYVYALAAIGARLTATFGPLLLRLDVEGVAPLIRRVFTLQGVGDVYEPTVVGFRAALGVGIHFP